MARWLDRREAARHLSVHPDALSRLVREGVVPKPNYALGPRSPRWDEQELDQIFYTGIASTRTREAVDAYAEKLAQGHYARRAPRARRREL